MKVIFFHNTLPAYRIPFFNSLAQLVELKIVFTNIKMSEVIYGEKSNLKLLKNCQYTILDKSKDIKEQISNEITDDCDLVHLPVPDGKYELYVSLICLKTAKNKNIRTALYWIRWTPENSLVPIKQRIKNKIRNFVSGPIARHADVCICSGIKSEKQFTELGVKKENIKYMHYSTDVSTNSEKCDIYEKYSINKNQKIILYFGRIIERKGLLNLIQAFELCCFSNVQLIIAGTGEEYCEKCKQYVNIHKLDNVHFIGLIPSRQRKSFFETADVFVLPSIFDKGIPEPWGQTVNEALQCGCRVIASDAVGAAYDLINDRNGVIYKAEDVSALQNALRELMYKDLKRLEVMDTIKDYTCEKMANDMLDAYEFACKKYN